MSEGDMPQLKNGVELEDKPDGRLTRLHGEKRLKTRLAKIDELMFDVDLYPRMKVGWLTAYTYAQAMRAGAVFPPILVGTYEGKNYVVDGWHRIEARKMLNEDYVEAVVKKYENKREMFVEAINLNTIHGRPLTPQEKSRLINKLKDLEFSLQEISSIVKVPLDKIEMFQARTIIGPDGTPVYLKSVVAKAKPDIDDALNVNMDSFNVRSVRHLLEQLIELLESNVYPLEELREQTIQLLRLLQEKLKLATIQGEAV